jgi:tellurite resistance protein TerC
MDFTLTNWLLFLAFIGLCLALDLGLLSKNNAKPSFKTAGLMTLLWLAIALAFSALLFVYQSSSTALDFLTGYIMELSLSMDNIFVFILIFRYFKVPIHLQHRVLFWGIIGAVAMRFIMIISGVYLIKKFEWLFYVFGAILIYSAYKMITHHTPTDGMQNTGMINWLKKHLRITEDFDGDRFITTYNGKIYLTPLSLVLFLIEQADLVFAIDSIEGMNTPLY